MGKEPYAAPFGEDVYHHHNAQFTKARDLRGFKYVCTDIARQTNGILFISF